MILESILQEIEAKFNPHPIGDNDRVTEARLDSPDIAIEYLINEHRKSFALYRERQRRMFARRAMVGVDPSGLRALASHLLIPGTREINEQDLELIVTALRDKADALEKDALQQATEWEAGTAEEEER